MTPPPANESQRIQSVTDDQIASRADVLKVDRDTRITTSLAFFGTVVTMVVLAVIGYRNLVAEVKDIKADYDRTRTEAADLKAQLAGVSAQLLSMSTDLKIANAVNAARSSDRWTAQMMAEFATQLKDATKDVVGIDRAMWPSVRNIQSAVGVPGP